jgi:hypothetical protein
MSGDQLWGLAGAATTLALAAFLLYGIRYRTNRIYRGMQDPGSINWGPTRFRWPFRGTQRQALIMAWTLPLLLGGLGLAFLLRSFGVPLAGFMD